MLENCLKHKIIRDFLKNYSEEKWPIIIPSLIEIAILNLKSSFKTLFFSEEDFKNILSDLKENLNLGNPFITQKEKIRKKPSTDWRNGKQTCYEDYEIICRDNTKKTLYDEPYDFYSKNNYNNYSNNNNYNSNYNIDYRNNYYNNYQNQNLGFNFYDFTSKNRKNEREISQEKIRRENEENKKNIIETQSRIKKLIDIDKENYIKNKGSNSKEKKQFNDNDLNKKIPRVNYAISYDKNLQPEKIEKKVDDRKKGKKVQKGKRRFNTKNNEEESKNTSSKNTENYDENKYENNESESDRINEQNNPDYYNKNIENYNNNYPNDNMNENIINEKQNNDNYNKNEYQDKYFKDNQNQDEYFNQNKYQNQDEYFNENDNQNLNYNKNENINQDEFFKQNQNQDEYFNENDNQNKN